MSILAGFRFVTVLGQRSDISCWDYLVPELKRRKLFFSTKIYCGSLSRVYFFREASFLKEYPSFELECGRPRLQSCGADGADFTRPNTE